LSDIFASSMEPVGAIELRPHHQRGSEFAEIPHTAGTVGTPTARGQESQDNGIAFGELINAHATLNNCAGTFVATDNRQRDWQITGYEMLIRMAQSRGRKAYKYLASTRRVEVNLFDFPFLTQTPQYRSTCLHVEYVLSVATMFSKYII